MRDILRKYYIWYKKKSKLRYDEFGVKIISYSDFSDLDIDDLIFVTELGKYYNVIFF